MRLLNFIFCILLVGCSTPTYKIVYDIPEIKLPPDPVPYIKNLSDTSTPDEVMKSWVATATAYKGWNEAVKKQISNLK